MSRAVIAEVAAAIREEQRFTQGALARDKHGEPCEPYSKKATRWCPIGAAYMTTRTKTDSFKEVYPDHCASACAAMSRAAGMLHDMSMESVTDKLGHAAVMEVLRLAWKIADTKKKDDRR